MSEPRKEKEHEVVYSRLAERTSEPQSEDATELTEQDISALRVDWELRMKQMRALLPGVGKTTTQGR